jgi:hypothetical protein
MDQGGASMNVHMYVLVRALPTPSTGMEGVIGTTSHSMAIAVDSLEEGPRTPNHFELTSVASGTVSRED